MTKRSNDHTTTRPNDQATARLHHVSLPMTPGDGAAARAFYGTLLELAEVAPSSTPDGLEEIWFRLAGGTELHLFAEPPMGQDHSARHFCLAVEDVEGLRVRLEAAGVTVVGGPPLPGQSRYFCRDPFGNLLEMTTIQEIGSKK